MLKQTMLFLFLLSVPLLTAPIVSAQQPYLPGAELNKILSDRTFAMTDSEEAQQNSHVYFAGDGRYTILYPSGNIRATDKWNIDGNDNLCLRKALRSAGTTDYITRCGKVSLAGPNALNLYNEQGARTKTLQFLGNGDLLGQFAR
ncbi:MAG: hypothetical protein M0P70_08395 [Desulfobulbaceae bacterium]|nr:hypothetical protein [Desulfobulbaceae bacterium]